MISFFHLIETQIKQWEYVAKISQTVIPQELPHWQFISPAPLSPPSKPHNPFPRTFHMHHLISVPNRILCLCQEFPFPFPYLHQFTYLTPYCPTLACIPSLLKANDQYAHLNKYSNLWLHVDLHALVQNFLNSHKNRKEFIHQFKFSMTRTS